MSKSSLVFNSLIVGRYTEMESKEPVEAQWIQGFRVRGEKIYQA